MVLKKSFSKLASNNPFGAKCHLLGFMVYSEGVMVIQQRITRRQSERLASNLFL